MLCCIHICIAIPNYVYIYIYSSIPIYGEEYMGMGLPSSCSNVFTETFKETLSIVFSNHSQAHSQSIHKHTHRNTRKRIHEAVTRANLKFHEKTPRAPENRETCSDFSVLKIKCPNTREIIITDRPGLARAAHSQTHSQKH